MVRLKVLCDACGKAEETASCSTRSVKGVTEVEARISLLGWKLDYYDKRIYCNMCSPTVKQQSTIGK